MSLFDDNPSSSPEQEPLSISRSEVDAEGKPLTISRAEADAAQPVLQLPEPPLSGDPFRSSAEVPVFVTATKPQPLLPEDLRISWSWLHLLVFILYAIISFVVVQTSFLFYYMPQARHFANRQQLEQFFISKPFFVIGSMVAWEGSLLLFLYVTIAVLPGAPFWRSLGWRKLNPINPSFPRSPWLYLAFGCALSFAVFIVTAAAKPPENAPIEELLTQRATAIFFMAMAVLFAPLAEETLFRGYLFPLLARFASAIARFLGVESTAAIRAGAITSILLTGLLFGLVHGFQLAWSFSLVLTLIGVGIIFTYARARTGTVVASYLLHLGYNSTIALVTIIGLLASKGLTKLPHRH